ALVVLLTRKFADRLRASPRATRWLNRVAGTMLVGFGVKLVLSK
ncbi:MAG: lysine transporter LysE, partial [Burkholderiales bacterium]|nr:lysine transporter LysE [Burkholderiales bacterium]